MITRCPETLFRKQAVKALSARPYGRPISATPEPWRWLTGLVFVFAAVLAFFLATAEFARKESVRGWLVARDGVSRITPDVGGIVERIASTSGDRVEAGDPIIYLTRQSFLQDGRSSVEEIIRQLRTQIAAIDRRGELLQAEAEIEAASVDAQLHSLDLEQNTLSQEMREQRLRLDAANDRLARLEVAARGGAATAWDVSRQQDECALLRQAWRRMQQNKIALDRERGRLKSRVERLPVETEGLLSSLQSERSRLQQQMTAQEFTQHVVLKSPIAGQLASVEVREGGTVAANQLLATVTPRNPAMIAEVYVPSRAVGFIRRGQPVRLSYDAFPPQKFGTFAGEIGRISDFILMPSEVPQTFHLREATFKVQIEIQAAAVTIDARNATLRPGMLLAAEIVLERRSLADWLLEPLRLRGRGDV